MIINSGAITRKEDNIHTPVIRSHVGPLSAFLMMHTCDFGIIYIKVRLSPLGRALRVYHHLSSASICPAEKDPRWGNESPLMPLPSQLLPSQPNQLASGLTSPINARSVMHRRAVIYNARSELNSVNYSYLLCG